jgi:hypothetical protein
MDIDKGPSQDIYGGSQLFDGDQGSDSVIK